MFGLPTFLENMDVRKIHRFGMAVGWAAVFWLGSSGLSRGAQYGDAVVGVVEGEVLTVYDLQEFASREERRLQRLYAGDELRKRLAELRRVVAQRLIERELVYAEFKALGAKVPLTLLQQREDEIIHRRADGDRVKFEEMLAREGMTMEEFEDEVKKQLAIDLLLQEKVYRFREVKPAEVEAYYREHRSDLAEKAGVRLQAIVLKKENGKYSDDLEGTVKEIQRKLKKGTPFGELARQYSEGPRADEGGDQGWISEPTGKLKKVLATMKVGDVSPTALDLGTKLYIIKLSDRRDTGVPVLDDKLRKHIEDILREKNQKERYRAFIDELRNKFHVETPDDFDHLRTPDK